jgi:MscS family membrane protein
LSNLLDSWGLGGRIEGWMVQVFVVVFLTATLALVQRLVFGHLARRAQRSRTSWDDALVEAVRVPLVALVWVIGLAFAAEITHAATEAPIFQAVEPIRDVAVITLLAWFLVRLIHGIERQAMDPAVPFGSSVDATTAGAIGKLLRATVIITAALIALQTLGFSVSGVLAFGGIGGIAVGFAARDLLANFFGGLMIYLDRPFRQGDWIRSPDREIEGTVEQIGWRLTVIRTFDMRPLYVPNAVFNQVAIENPSRMLNRRIFETIGVRYDDFAVLPAIVADVDAMLRAHPEIAQERTLMVYFTTFGASSLDFFVYAFTRTRVWAEYHRVKQDVLLKVGEIIASHGAEIAFPTSTVHLHTASLDAPAPRTEERERDRLAPLGAR